MANEKSEVETPGERSGGPPLPLRLLGQGLSVLIARAPAVWPLLRRGTRRYWDRMAGSWEERRQPSTPEHLAPLSAACGRLPSAPTRVLELGTGTGAGARTLAKCFPDAEVVAVDVSSAMVRAAESTTPAELRRQVRFDVADAAALPFDDGSFELVAPLNMPAYFAETARPLTTGGHLIVASSLGSATPYHTPERLLRKGFARHGVESVEVSGAGAGSYFLARKR